jgi:hypothetical protein
MHQAGFEPTFLVFERAKTVHALDRGAAVIGKLGNYVQKRNVYKLCDYFAETCI